LDLHDSRQIGTFPGRNNRPVFQTAEAAVLAPHTLQRRFLMGAACFLAAAAVAVLSIDMPVARWAAADGFRRLGDLDSLIVWSEVFAHGAGVGVILLLVAVLYPARVRCLPRLALLSLGAGLAANVAKLLFARIRPHGAELGGTALATFDGTMFPTSSMHQSFPSGHTAAAVGLAVGLAWLYPRGRWMFAAFAAMAAAQRWSNRDHFVSDTCAGAAIAMVVAALVLGDSAVARWCAWFEQGGAISRTGRFWPGATKAATTKR
jgi:membrane-associated phospholipid phosphatase